MNNKYDKSARSEKEKLEKTEIGSKTKENIKEVAKKTKKKTKQIVKKAKEKYNSPRGKKVREWVKKTSEIVGSHLATIKAGITLSNDESKLIESLKNNLNKKSIYPSKSEIIRAGLWNLRKMNQQQLEEALKDLVKIKKTRVL